LLVNFAPIHAPLTRSWFDPKLPAAPLVIRSSRRFTMNSTATASEHMVEPEPFSTSMRSASSATRMSRLWWPLCVVQAQAVEQDERLAERRATDGTSV
jgi:hypothetical protein